MKFVTKPFRGVWRSLAAARTGLVGVVALVLVWQVACQVVIPASSGVPSPWRIYEQFRSDGLLLYVNAAKVTVGAAALGWLWGNGIAISLALLSLLVPFTKRLILQLGVVSYCLPIVAVGPLLAIIFADLTSRVILSAMAVLFTTLMGTMLGLSSADSTSLDVVTALGGGRWKQVTRIRVRSALPSLFGALQISVPAALLGSLLGEYIRGESGLGVMLIASQQGLNVPRTWAVVVVCTVISAGGYALAGVLGKALLPWARELNVSSIASAITSRRVRSGKTVVQGIGMGLLCGAVVVGLWAGFLWVFKVSSFLGKSPWDVWIYLFGSGGASNRALVVGQAVTTIRDAVLGLCFGSAAAVAVSVAFYLWPAVQRTLIGVALAIRSVPLVAMTPLIVLVFGRGLICVIVIGSMITFFPTLVYVSLALKKASNDAANLLSALGASRWHLLSKVQIPSAVPALFASLRIAAPLALTGALLAEWLATGQGMGWGLMLAMTDSEYDQLWAQVVVVTLASLLLYKVISILEEIVMAHYSDEPTGSKSLLSSVRRNRKVDLTSQSVAA